MSSFRQSLPVVGQCGIVLFGLVLLHVVPPASGAMLLVPLTVQARASLVPVAIAHHARLVANGPWAGSLVVDGRRDLLASVMLRHGIIPLATDRRGCGDLTP